MIFKPTDFDYNILKLNRENVANTANNILNKLIESSPVVYRGSVIECDDWSTQQMKGHTHKARLMFIEEIVKEPCKHDPYRKYLNINSNNCGWSCAKCGVELQATWSEVKK